MVTSRMRELVYINDKNIDKHGCKRMLGKNDYKTADKVSTAGD